MHSSLANAWLVSLALLAGGRLSTDRPCAPAAGTHGERLLAVPEVDSMPALDGELDDPVWLGRVARTRAFVDLTGVEARPYSDARIAWTRGWILVALYAADEDIRSTGPRRDAFRVTLGAASFEVSAGGALDRAPAGTRIGREADGTIDEVRDEDEEWVVELAVPLASVGLEGRPGERIAFGVERCDTPRDDVRRCGMSRATTLVLADAR